MIRFVPLTAELLDWALLLGADDTTRALTNGVPQYHARLVDGSGLAEAMLDGGDLVGIGGITQHWPGRAEAWLLLLPGITRRQRLSALRRCQLQVAKLQRSAAFRRIEMYVMADAPWCVRFGRLMGFRHEGTARAWDPLGRDYCLFARVAEG